MPAYRPAMLASSTWAVQMLDVARSAADVLLAGLQCQAQRRPSSGVRADADQAAGQGASGVLLHGDERRRGVRRSPSGHRSAAPIRW